MVVLRLVLCKARPKFMRMILHQFKILGSAARQGMEIIINDNGVVCRRCIALHKISKKINDFEYYQFEVFIKRINVLSCNDGRPVTQ